MGISTSKDLKGGGGRRRFFYVYGKRLVDLSSSFLWTVLIPGVIKKYTLSGQAF
jgi:hypothetical protein